MMRDRKLYDGNYRRDLKLSYFTQCNRLLDAMDEPLMGDLEWTMHTPESLEWDLIRLLKLAALPETYLNTKNYKKRKRNSKERYVYKGYKGKWYVLIKYNKHKILFTQSYDRKDNAVRGRDRALKRLKKQLIRGLDLVNND